MLKKTVGTLVLLLGAAQATCDHPFFPVKAGWTWTYQGVGQASSTYQQLQQNVTADAFTSVVKFPDGTSITSGWKCTEQGLQSMDSGMVRGPGMEDFELKQTSSSGYRIPAASQWKVGAKWSYQHLTEGSMAGMSMNIAMEVQEEIVGQESVTVPAGTFQAWKVQSRIKTTVQNPELAAMMESMKDQMPAGVELPTMGAPVETTSTSWIAQGVGVVKSEGEGMTTVLVKLEK